MKNNLNPRGRGKNNYKAIKQAAAFAGKSSSGRSILAAVGVILLLISLFFFLNEKFFGIKGIPTLKDLYEGAGMGSGVVSAAEGTAEVHFIDVGQGDCELIRTNNKTVLIDCGERDCYREVIGYIEKLGIKRLDYVVVSHPHSDHMGGMSYILDNFDIGTVIMPNIKKELTPTSNAFKRLLESIGENGIEVEYAKAGTSYPLDDGEFTLLSPVKDYDDLNNYSVTVRFSHGKNSFLFTGDTEKEAESDILDSGANVSANVLKVAHHGSSTSTRKEFLKAVDPAYAVIEVGEGNDYGHPHKEILKRLEKADIVVYRTDIFGSIVFVSNGNDLEITSEKE